MSTKIILKKSSVASKIPTTGDLDYGELAINYQDGKLWYKDASNNIKAFIDSANVQSAINAINFVDSADVTAIIAATAFLDSADVLTLIDSAHIISHLQTYVTKTGTETLTNKTLTSPTINTPSIVGPASITKVSTFSLRDYTTNTYNTVLLSNNDDSALTADRTLFINVKNDDRSLILKGDLTLANNFTTVGNFATTLTTTGTTSVTLPTSGTLVSKDSSGNFSAGTITATFSGNLTGNVTGNVTGTVSTLSNFTTTNLTEGTNKYYTKVRVDSDIDLRVTKAFIDNLNVNADTLDGQHGTYYRINVYNSSGTLLN